MPSARRMILGHVMSGIVLKMNRRKSISSDAMETQFKRCLSTMDITLLGVGHMIGAGIYVMTGTVAHSIAGPGVILSFLFAGIASLLAALCYAEFGARVPKTGSAYIYTYVSIGEFWAFVIGWNLILENLIGAASIARALASYIDASFHGTISNFSNYVLEGYTLPEPLSNHPDFLAGLLCICFAFLLAGGVQFSTTFNSLLTITNLGVMATAVVLCVYYGDVGNWTSHGFLPFGLNGVLKGAATCFYAFVGFDSIATTGEEARDPGRSIPIATITSMSIVTLSYMLVSGGLTLVVPFWQINPNAALTEAFSSKGIIWAELLITLGAACGMTTSLMGSLYSLPRTMYSMANDGLLFGFMSKVNKRTQVPIGNLALSGLFSGIIASIFDLQHLVEFMSIGTFLAYTIVSACVIILRYRPEKPVPRISSTGTSSLPSPPTEGADSSDCNSLASAESEILEYCEGTGRLRTRYAWLGKYIGHFEPGEFVAKCTYVYVIICLLAFVLIFLPPKGQGSELHWWEFSLFIICGLVMLLCVFLISAHRRRPSRDYFEVPMVPLIPTLSILVNISLMFHLSPVTWKRFLIGMVIGMVIYFMYGIHYSKENAAESSYDVLMASSEAERGAKWGATLKSNMKIDKTPILGDDELARLIIYKCNEAGRVQRAKSKRLEDCRF